ncbi:hypothetical protein JCM10207_001744 [Rhodosporidiobolus poonsookiae]
MDPGRLNSLSPSPASSADPSPRRSEDSTRPDDAQPNPPHIAPSAAVSVGTAGALHAHAARQAAGRQGDSSPSTSSLLTGSHPAAQPHASLAADDTPIPLNHRRRTTRSASPSGTSLSSLSSRYSLLPLRVFQRLHLFVFLLSFLLLFLLPVAILVGYRREVQWAPFGLGVASWLAGETLREVIFELFTTTTSAAEGRITLPPDSELEDDVELAAEAEERRRMNASLALPTIVHAIAQELLRLGAVALAVNLLPSEPSVLSSLSPLALTAPKHLPSPRAPLPPLDPLFFSALWLSLGWASVEILWGSRRLWKQLDLYDDVLPGGNAIDEEVFLAGVPRAGGHRADGLNDGASRRSVIEHDHDESGAAAEQDRARAPPLLLPGEFEAYAHDVAERAEEEDEEAWFQQRVKEQQRDELEAQLGVPLFEIPVGVVLIWRIDSILLSLLLTLLLSLPFRLTPPSLFAFPLAPTFLSAASLHALLSYLWLARVRAWGVPACSYGSLVVLLAGAFAVLGAWGVLE